MRFLERLFASRAARIGIVLVWLVFAGLGGSFAQRFQNIQKNEESSFLPGSSESVKELTLAKRFRPASASRGLEGTRLGPGCN